MNDKPAKDMSTEERMTVYRCPECGEVERTGESPPRWTHSGDTVTHYHPGEKPHWPGKYFPAEEVQVVPVSRLEAVETGVCANCCEEKLVVTLPDWPAGTGPCELCPRCIGLLLDGRRIELDKALADHEALKERLLRVRTALHLNLAKLATGLDATTAKNLADLVNDLNDPAALTAAQERDAS